MRSLAVSTVRPRWVLDQRGPGPLTERAIEFCGKRQSLAGEFEALPRGSARDLEIVKVVGPEAANFDLEGERPQYWESLRSQDEFLGVVAPWPEVYRRDRDLRGVGLSSVVDPYQGVTSPLESADDGD